MKKNLLYLFFSLNFSIIGFAQDFQWARQIKGITTDYNDFANGLAVDSAENTYTIGSTNSPLFDLDPTQSGEEIIDYTNANSSFKGAYLIKTDVNGNYIWGLTFDLSKGPFQGNNEGIDVKIGSDGNIYALLTLQELSATSSITNSFIKIIKLSPDGVILSTISIPQYYGNNNNLYVYSFDLDSQNNIFISGWFFGNFTIDSSNPNSNLNSNGVDDYLLKINNNGKIDWVKQFNTNSNSNNEVIVRPDGNINLLLKKSNDCFLYNIDNINSSIIWQKDFKNQRLKTFHVSNNGIVILGEKNSYDTIDVDPSPNVLNISANNCFITFLNLNGDFVDVKLFHKPTDGDVTFTAVTTDSNGNYFFGGTFSNTLDMNPSISTFNLTSNGYKGEAFYLKLDANRNFDSAIKLGDENPKLSPYNNCEFLRIKKIKIVNNNNYLMGDFMWICDFDPSITNQYTFNTINISTINYDGFILKLGPCNSAKIVGDIDQTFCSASNPTIRSISPNSSSIIWYDSANSTTPLASTTPILDNKKYYATQKNGNCPESTDRLEITAHIIPSPEAPILLNAEFCLSENAKLSYISILGQNLKWYKNLTDSSDIPSATVLQNTTLYFASQTVNGCESERSPIPVIVYNTLHPTATSSQTFCIEQNATISDITISGENIKWFNALTNGTDLPNTTQLQSGITYYASQTINGCESERTPILITIQNTTTPTGDANQSFCSTQNATLNDIDITGMNIKWYDVSNNELPNTSLITDNATYYASQTVNSCESVNKLAVNIFLINTLNATNYSVEFCDEGNDGKETINLSNYNQNLIANPIGNNFSYYSSFVAAENQIANSRINSITNYILSTGSQTLFVRIDSQNGCHQVVELNLILYTKPIIPIQDLMPICEGSSITINAGMGYDNYLWSTGETSATILIHNPGNYSVMVTNNYNTISCSSTKKFIVNKSTAAVITSIETRDWTDNQNMIKVFVTGEGDYEYSLDGSKFQDSNEFLNIISGQYSVYVKDKNGCGTVADEVYLLMYPKFFTPNGDNYNDTWSIRFSENEPQLNVKILDRYGKLITTLNQNESWNGTYNGQLLPSTDYWFVVTRADGKEYKGHFSMKR
jgi:gliding motility-associated-like protein